MDRILALDIGGKVNPNQIRGFQSKNNGFTTREGRKAGIKLATPPSADTLALEQAKKLLEEYPNADTRAEDMFGPFAYDAILPSILLDVESKGKTTFTDSEKAMLQRFTDGS